jgi:hypothetical protein
LITILDNTLNVHYLSVFSDTLYLMSPLQQILCISAIFLTPASVFASQVNASAEKSQSNIFAAAASYSQSVAQWELAVMGGSLLIVVGSSHRRPASCLVRACYLLFLPGWLFLGASVWFASRVQRVYVGYLAFSAADLVGSVKAVNSDMLWQNRLMIAGFSCFLIWLVAYLLWWVFAADADPNVKAS